MLNKIQKYSFLLLGIFLVSLCIQSTHFLQHTSEDSNVHNCKNHDHDASDQSDDCSLCDFTLASFTDVEFFEFNPFSYISYNSLVNAYYVSDLSFLNYSYFSLRAPPLA